MLTFHDKQCVKHHLSDGNLADCGSLEKLFSIVVYYLIMHLSLFTPFLKVLILGGGGGLKM